MPEETVQATAAPSTAEDIQQGRLSSDDAADRAKKDFETAESYRRLNHDWRWTAADLLYLGWKKDRFWEGTKIKRANIPVYLTFEHIEAILPKIITVLFGESYWFDGRPYPNVNINESRMMQELMLAQYRELNHSTGVREVFRRAIKSACKYGNGIVYQGWARRTETVIDYIDAMVPVTQSVPDPQFGSFEVPTGQMRRMVQEQPRQEEINELVLEYVSIRDFFIDPNCPSPFPWEAQYCFRRKLVPIRVLKQFASIPEMAIPTDGELRTLAMGKHFASSDQGQQMKEGIRGASYNPALDYATGGENKRIELLEYWTQDRLIYLLGRKKVIYNIPNPYGGIPFYNIYYADVLDRFYALAMSDILEPEQRIQEKIINSRLDELSLRLNPPARRKRGQPIPLSQLRRRPGLVTEVDDPEKDLIYEENRPINDNAYVEVAASEARSQRRDGITELAVLGSPGEGNSANRTATGISTQVSASLSRIGYLVENIQEGVIVPMLDDALLLNKRFNTPQQVMEILGAEGQAIQIDPSIIRRVEMRFEMRAANKANSRAAMLQVAPLVIQTLLNPVLIEQLHSEGKTVEVMEIVNMVLDATNYRPHKSALIRDLTQQEIMSLQQNAIDQTKLATQQIRGESQMEITQEKEASELVKTIMKLMADASKPKPEKDKKPN